MRLDQKRRAKENLETLLLYGLNFGIATPLTEQDGDDIRQAVQAKVHSSDMFKRELQFDNAAIYSSNHGLSTITHI